MLSPVSSLNPAHDEVYSIQHYVIKFVGDLWQVNGFLRVFQFPPVIKTDRHDLTVRNIVESSVKCHSLNPNPISNMESVALKSLQVTDKS